MNAIPGGSTTLDRIEKSIGSRRISRASGTTMMQLLTARGWRTGSVPFGMASISLDFLIELLVQADYPTMHFFIGTLKGAFVRI